MVQKFHAFMFPWFAFGHMIPYLHLANKLAEKGHRVTFLLPKKAQKQLEHHNLFSDNILFHPLTIPPVAGLLAGAVTASDIPISLGKFLSAAMDLTRDQVAAAVSAMRPDLILLDFAYWVPEMAKEYKVKSILYSEIAATTMAHNYVPSSELGVPPPGYPSSKVMKWILNPWSWRKLEKKLMKHVKSDLLIRLRLESACYLCFHIAILCCMLIGQSDMGLLIRLSDMGNGFAYTLYHRMTTGLMSCDIISMRTCEEVEGKFCDYIARQYQRKVLLTGPMLPEPDKSKPLENQWSSWLTGFRQGSVVFCALGSQFTLEKDQLQELCSGMELIGLPFLVAVTPPKGAKTIQEVLPEGFEERVKGRGVVWGEWVQQPLILDHPSVGCFVSHCGFGSMWESLMSNCQIVLLPFLSDQIFNTRLMTEELEVSVEVPIEETGCLVSPRLLTGYTDKFVKALQDLVNDTNLE
ncbi:unnamed protein product [Brassica oleracea]